MNWQSLLVGIIVASALLFVVWRLPGAATRLRFVGFMKRISRDGLLARLARRLEARERRNDSACSGCSAAEPHPPPASPANTRKP